MSSSESRGERSVTLSRDSLIVILETLRWAIREQERIDPDVEGLVGLYAAYDLMLEALIGEEGARALRQSEGARGLPVPRSWIELQGLLEPICRWAWPMFSGFARAARPRYGRITSTLFLQVCAGVALQMRDEWDPAMFPPPLEDDFQRAWAKVLDGELISPEYTSDELEIVTFNPFREANDGDSAD